MGGDLRVVALFFCRFFRLGRGGWDFLERKFNVVSLNDSLFSADGVRTRSALIKNEGLITPRAIYPSLSFPIDPVFEFVFWLPLCLCRTKYLNPFLCHLILEPGF